MKKLKIILPSKWFCFLLLAITFLVCIHFFLSPHSSKYTGSETTFTGTIMNIEVSGGMLSLEIMGKEKLIGSYFFLTEEEKDSFLVTYSLGDTIYFEGNLVLPSKNSVFNLFNYKEYLERKEIYYLVEIIMIQKIDSSKNLLYQLKNKINHHISKYQSSSYLQAFLLGDTSKIDDDILATYQKNGVSHLLAISGMHVSFLSGMLLLLFKKIRFSTLIQYLSVIIFLLFYMILSGNTPSISRAVILFSLISINKVFDLKISTLQLLLITFCLLVINNPNILFDVGFEYSFLISFYLILFQKKLNQDSYLKGLFQISFFSFLVSLPISIFYFYQVNLFSILLNLVFVPLVSFIIFPLSFLTFLLPFLDSVFSFLTQFMETLSLFFSNHLSFLLIFRKPHLVWIIFYYFFLLLFRYDYKKIGSLVIILLLSYQYFYLFLFPQTFFIMIDVGQGDSLLIHSNNHTLLVDTGGKIEYKREKWQIRKTKTIAEKTLIPLLKSYGIRKLDYLILTHGDTDHMKEANNLVRNFSVSQVIFNPDSYNDLELSLIKLLEQRKIKYYQNVKRVGLGNLQLSFLNTKLYDNENDNSNVLYFSYFNFQFLLMGDASKKRESDILVNYNLQNIDFLKVGHHGSNTSSSKEFISKISPKYSLISVGKDNRYGHPKDSVLDILKDTKIYRTDINGSIEIQLKKNKYKIRTCSP